MRQIQRRHLPRSRWTARTALAEGACERHVEVFEVGTGERRDEVTMRAILTGNHYVVTIAALRDEAAWTPGWISVVSDEDDAD